MAENTRSRIVLIVTITLIILAGLTAIAVILFAPPGVGRVTEVGHHPAFFPEAFCDAERYYIVIEHPTGNQSWTWYIDEWYWKHWEVGDKVGVGTW